jgi:hypothetical protein
VQTDNHILLVISDLRHHVDEICTLLGYYAVYNVDYLPKFRDNLPVQISTAKKSKKRLKIGANRLSQNVGKELALYAVNNPEELSFQLYFTLLYTF